MDLKTYHLSAQDCLNCHEEYNSSSWNITFLEEMNRAISKNEEVTIGEHNCYSFSVKFPSSSIEQGWGCSKEALGHYMFYYAKEITRKYTFKQEQFEKLFNQFSEQVKNKSSTELQYDDYRRIKNSWVGKEKILVAIRDDTHECVLLDGDDPSHCYYYFILPDGCKLFNKKENNFMKMPSMNLDFGPVTDSVRLSPYGIAVTNDGDTWFTYDTVNDKTVDVTGFTFDFKGMLYKMPVAINSICEGDVIIHNGKPMYVTGVEETFLDVVDILDSEIKNVMPVTNMFGFNFVTKIVSIMNMANMSTPNPNNPFGNILPFIMMQSVFGEDGFMGEDNDFMKMMFMSSMFTGGNNPFANLFNPPQPCMKEE